MAQQGTAPVGPRRRDEPAGSVAPPEQAVDPRLLVGARRVVAEHGLTGLTLERLAAASGISRMTLHRRGVTVPGIVEALLADIGQEYLTAVLPALTGPADAGTRLRDVLFAIFGVADRHLPLLAGLYPRADSVFHDPPGRDAADGAVPSTTLFTAPIERLLRDGAADGTLRAVEDPAVTAAALFNVAGWGYVHMRHAQRWPADRAAAAVLDLMLPGLGA